MKLMAKLKRTDYYLRTRTSPPIHAAFRRFMLRVEEKRLAPLPHKSKGSEEYVLSAIVAAFLAQPEDEQEALIRRWHPEVFKQIREHFEGADVEPLPPEPETPRSPGRRARGAG